MTDLFQKVQNSAISKNGKLDEKKFFHFVYADSVQSRIRSVPCPPAQSNQLCSSQTDLDLLYNTAVYAIDKLMVECMPLACIIELQLLYGLRVSEVLAIHSNDILSSGHVMVKGLKGSESRLIIAVKTAEWLQAQKNKGRYIFMDFNRYYLYRLYKKLGLSAQFRNRRKKSVTHLFRHMLIKSFKHQKINTHDSQKFIGHKARKSTEVYEK